MTARLNNQHLILGSTADLAYSSRPPYQDRENPYSRSLFGEWWKEKELQNNKRTAVISIAQLIQWIWKSPSERSCRLVRCFWMFRRATSTFRRALDHRTYLQMYIHIYIYMYIWIWIYIYIHVYLCLWKIHVRHLVSRTSSRASCSSLACISYPSANCIFLHFVVVWGLGSIQKAKEQIRVRCGTRGCAHSSLTAT